MAADIGLPIALVRIVPVDFKRGNRTFRVVLNHPTRAKRRVTLEGGEDHYKGGWYAFYERDENGGRSFVEWLKQRSAEQPSASIEDMRYRVGATDEQLRPLLEVIEVPKNGIVKQLDPQSQRWSEPTQLPREAHAYWAYLRQMATVAEARKPFNAPPARGAPGSVENPYNLRVDVVEEDPPSERERLTDVLEAVKASKGGGMSRDEIASLLDARMAPLVAELQSVQAENAQLRDEVERLQSEHDARDTEAIGEDARAVRSTGEEVVLSVGKGAKKKRSSARRPRLDEQTRTDAATASDSAEA